MRLGLQAEPESSMVALLSKNDGVVVGGWWLLFGAWRVLDATPCLKLS